MAVTINVTLGVPARRRRRRILLTALAAFALAVPSGAFASHLFTDVPTSNTFHANISNVATAGVATGCGPTTYCPGDYVTRGQMAAFLNRGLGRAAEVEFNHAVMGTAAATVGSVTITSGLTSAAVDGAKQFIYVDVDATLIVTNASGCPCAFAWGITGVDGYFKVFTIGATGYYPMSASGVMAVSTPGPTTIDFDTYIATGIAGGNASTAYTAYGSITALTVPFGSTGSNTAGTASTPVAVEGVPLAP